MKDAIQLVLDCIHELEEHASGIEDEDEKGEVKELIADVELALDHYR